jgi:endonuclease/exonuclease/phosphatase family metal-dependent hydrolase
VLRFFTFLFFCLCFSASGWACPQPDCVRIGTWNLEWLGSDHRQLPSDTATVDHMADLIAHQLSIDLIVLEEVNTDLEGRNRDEYFSLQPWQELRKALEQNGYQFSKGSSGYAQHVVLAWRSPVIQVDIARELAIPDHFELNDSCHSSRLRKPLAGRFRAGKMDFWLVGVHLKAQGADQECSMAIRQKQLSLLSHQLSTLKNQDTDILLAGDFNTSSHNPALNLLQMDFEILDDRNYRNPASGNTSYLGHGDDSTRPGPVIDHLMGSRSILKSWRPGSTTIYRPASTTIFAETFSDHVPVWTDFSLTTPD